MLYDVSIYILAFIGGTFVLWLIVDYFLIVTKSILHDKSDEVLSKYNNLVTVIKQYLLHKTNKSLISICDYLVECGELKVDPEGNYITNDRKAKKITIK